MSFSQLKIKAGEHGRKTRVWLNGVEPPGLFDVKFQSSIDEPTVATLKVYATVEVDAEGAKVEKITICPKCREEKGRADCTEMGDENRKYIPA